jgi:hypothetical protein
MNDQILINLAPYWALGFDQLQWILMKSEMCSLIGDKRGLQADKSSPTVRWRTVSFIASSKGILYRCVEENGIQLSSEAAEYIEAMPETFQAWYQLHKRPSIPAPERLAA